MAQGNSNPILVVDGKTAARKAETDLLRELGYKGVTAAETGTEAWSVIRKSDVKLVICAWQLERDMSGFGLLKVVRSDEIHMDTPFLMVVDQITKKQVIEAGEAGVSDIILRPFTKDIFKRKVENTLTLEHDPKAVETRYLMKEGISLAKVGKYEEALSSFKRVLTINESAEVYYNLGYIKTAQGKYEEAILAFRRATQIDKAFAEAYKKMGEVYARLGRTEEAKTCLEQAAEIYMEKKKDDAAEEVFMKVLKVSPNTPNVFNSLGIVYRRQGKFEEAIRMYRKALKVSPRDEHIHYNLGKVLMTLKKYRDAAVNLKMAVEINPDFVEAANLIRSIQMGEGLE